MRRTLLTLVAIVGTGLASEAGPARCVDVALAAVKTVHPVHQALLLQGFERSLTLRALTADIEAFSWLVFVQEGRCPERLTVACLLHVVGAFKGRPYLRVIIPSLHRHRDNLIASLAHELQHAREVIHAAGVENAADMRQLFKRIGYESVARARIVTYETDAAVRVQDTVWRELLNNAPGRCP
jgi:hypothetical protein